MTPISLIVGTAAALLLAGIRAATANRLIRRRLTLSLVTFAGFAVLALVRVLFVQAPAGTADRVAIQAAMDLGAKLDSIGSLLFALGAINALVALALNPFRIDRVPDYFPTIVQDAIVIAVFLVAGIFVLGERWLTLSAVGGFVVGFALQDTLGNMFAGLAIQVEKPFRVGHRISVASYEGVVTEITWRATRLKTRAGNTVVLPNNVLSKEAITNYSEPTVATCLNVEVGITYDAPPNEVKRVLLQAVTGLELLLKTPHPEVIVADFGSSSIVYRVKFWVADFGGDDRARDQVRTAIYYALRRHRIDIPYPIQVQYQHEDVTSAGGERLRNLDRFVAAIDVFASLSDSDRAALVAEAAEHLYGAGETIVRQGAAGDSMFVVCRGEVRVTLEPNAQEVARIAAGGYFGEMSLLTGEPRTATVAALDDVVVLEITADMFRRLAEVHPAVIEQISLEVAARREGLARSREVAATVAVVHEERGTFLARVQKFLRFGA